MPSRRDPVDPGGDQHTARFFTGSIADLSHQFEPGRIRPQANRPGAAEATAGGGAADPGVRVDHGWVDEVAAAGQATGGGQCP